MAKGKALRGNYYKGTKRVVGQGFSTDNLSPVWTFTNIDMAGKFAFDVHRDDFRHQKVIEKMIDYSNMTWAEVKRQTHDQGKSKHHYVQHESLSRDAQERLKAKELEDSSDALFSFALDNTLRIVGIREEERFKVLWYDPNHEVCPSAKKHT